LRRETFRVDVGDILEGQKVAVEVAMRADRSAPPRSILVCLTGGGVTRHYFDLRNGDDSSFSLAQAMADAGHAIVMIDHLGVGANAKAGRAAIAFIRKGGLGIPAPDAPVYGLGHSMGAVNTVVIQSRHHLYEGLILLGYPANGSPASLRPGAKAVAGNPRAIRAQLKDLTKEMFGEAIKIVKPRAPGVPQRENPRNMTDEVAARLFAPDAADPEGTKALKVVLAPVINVPTLFAILPGSHLPEMASIDKPLLVITGVHDFAYPPRDLDTLFANAPSISTFLPDGVGHNVFNFPSRDKVFAKIGEWLDERLTK
jgi:pimeloyl-ACP methyl ester carboxylesterase